MLDNKKNLKTLLFSICFVIALAIIVYSGINSTLLLKPTYSITSADCLSAGGNYISGSAKCCPKGYNSVVLDYYDNKYWCIDKEKIASISGTINEGITINSDSNSKKYYCKYVFRTNSDFNSDYNDLCREEYKWYERSNFNNASSYAHRYFNCLEKLEPKKLVSGNLLLSNYDWRDSDCGLEGSKSGRVYCAVNGPLSSCGSVEEGAACYEYVSKTDVNKRFHRWRLNAGNFESGYTYSKTTDNTKSSCEKYNSIYLTFYDLNGKQTNKIDVLLNTGAAYLLEGEIAPSRISGMKFLGWYKSSGVVNNCQSKTFLKQDSDGNYTVYKNDEGSYYPCYVSDGTGSNVDVVKVTFDTNGSSLSVQSVSGKIGDTTILPSVSRNGYKFLGWYDKRVRGIKVGDAGSSYKFKANVTLYAYWSKNITVEYNLNHSGLSSIPDVVEPGTTIKLRNATRDGYEFLGWYTTPTGGQKIGGSGTTYTVTEDITLHAHWKKIITSYTVKYDANGGTVNPASIKMDSGSKTVLPNATKKDHALLGWYTSKTGGTKVGDAGSPYIITKNVTLYAQWEKNVTTYKVTYDANGGTIAVGYVDIVSGKNIMLQEPTKEGYNFLGWYTSKTGGTKVGDAGASYTVTKNVTLYARWTEKTYVLTFDATGGVVNPEKLEVTMGEEITLPEATKENYAFLGWTYAPASFNIIGVAGSKFVVNETLTLYAKWVDANLAYKVEFRDYNSSVLSKHSCAITKYGEACEISAPKNDPVRENYNFLGWASSLTDCVNKNIWNDHTIITDDSVMYACYVSSAAENNNGSNNTLVIALVLVLVLGGAGAGYWYFTKMKKSNE